MVLQRERVPAGAAALLTVLLAVPTVVAPTWQLTTLDDQGGVVLFDQQLWSWGRARVLGAGGALVQDVWDPFGLVVLVALLLLALTGAVAWLLVDAAWVRVVAPVASAALVGHLVMSAAQRHGRPVRDDVHGLASSGSSTVVGWLESAAAVTGVVAVALLVLALLGWRMPSAWLARARALVAPADAGGRAPVVSPEGTAGSVGPSATWRPAEAMVFPPVQEPVQEPERESAREPVREPVHELMGQPGSTAEVDGRAGRQLRLTAATLGGVGVLLGVATAVWPTTVVAVRAPEVGEFTKGYEQRIWSWGRQVVYSSDGVLLDAYRGPDPVGRLVLLVLVLACAGAALAWWVARPGRGAELVAAVGLALALATVTGSLVERLSFDERSIGLQPGLVRLTTAAGWLEVASVAVLALALVVAVVAVLPGPATALAGWLSAASARLPRSRRSATSGPAGGGEGAPPATRPVARLQDPSSGGTRHTPSVGFSDDDQPGLEHR